MKEEGKKGEKKDQKALVVGQTESFASTRRTFTIFFPYLTKERKKNKKKRKKKKRRKREEQAGGLT